MGNPTHQFPEPNSSVPELWAVYFPPPSPNSSFPKFSLEHIWGIINQEGGKTLFDEYFTGYNMGVSEPQHITQPKLCCRRNTHKKGRAQKTVECGSKWNGVWQLTLEISTKVPNSRSPRTRGSTFAAARLWELPPRFNKRARSSQKQVFL